MGLHDIEDFRPWGYYEHREIDIEIYFWIFDLQEFAKYIGEIQCSLKNSVNGLCLGSD